MKWAIVNENTVTAIMESDSHPEGMEAQAIVDVTDQAVQVGWVLSGNKIEPMNLEILYADKIASFQQRAPELIMSMYAKNTISGITTPQSDALTSKFADVIFRLREGLWPTAIYRLQQKAPDEMATQEVINHWISTIYSEMLK